MARSVARFKCGESINLRIAAPHHEGEIRSDNVKNVRAKIVTVEWGGGNKKDCGLKEEWFYRLDILPHQMIPESELLEQAY